MKTSCILSTVWAAAVFTSASCDQKDAVFPEDTSATGQCGSWYPGGGDDAGMERYEVEEDMTFPCLVWESVHTSGMDTWLNVGELYLETKHANTNAKALVVAVVGTDCSGCQLLIEELGEREDQFSEVAAMVALTHGSFASEGFIPLDEAVYNLSAKGWPDAWYITNDAENHFPMEDYNGIPWVVIVRLSDMKVVSRSNTSFSGANVDDLLAFIGSL